MPVVKSLRWWANPQAVEGAPLAVSPPKRLPTHGDERKSSLVQRRPAGLSAVPSAGRGGDCRNAAGGSGGPRPGGDRRAGGLGGGRPGGCGGRRGGCRDLG